MSVFPGGVAVTGLQVYDWEAEDGCRGGTPHLHTASSEGYVVIGGTGAVQTISAAGFAEDPLKVGDVLWFTPGTVHRLINHGDLQLVVVMSNAGLPESGDAVLTFPPDILDDPEAYAAASALPSSGDAAAATRRRRDLALKGFAQLRDGGSEAFAALHHRAVRIVRSRVPGWQRLWEATVEAETERTRARLVALAEGDPSTLSGAEVTRATPVADGDGYGMCGLLRTWQWPAG